MNTETFRLLLSILVFAFGASIASFLNVVIYRVPRGESIVSPPSHCPKCGKPIRWYCNLPIVSWIFLRGRCLDCKSPISPRYLFVELLGGALFLATFSVYAGFFARGEVHLLAVLSVVESWIWISLLIVGSFIDFDHKLLPDFVTVGGMVLGVLTSAILASVFGSAAPVLYSLAGLAKGLGLMWLIRFLGTKAFKREAMGFGDVLLMGAVGAISGPVMVILVLILSALLGSIVGLTLIALNKARLGKFVEIPYGPYIAISAIIAFFYGAQIINWYLALIGVEL